MKQAEIFRAPLLSAIAAICLLLSAVSTYAAGQTSAGTAPQEQASTPSKFSGAFPAMLLKPLDSKKLKVGDPVVVQSVAKIHTASGVLIPSGTKMIGHVTQAQARSKGDPESSLAVVFDKLVLGKNEEVPVKGTLQAIGPAIYKTGPPDAGPATPGTTLSGGGAKGVGASGTAGFSTPPPSSSTQSDPVAGGVHPMVTPESKGVVGVKNLQMDDKSVISSTGKDVKLDEGTQIMIHVE